MKKSTTTHLNITWHLFTLALISAVILLTQDAHAWTYSNSSNLYAAYNTNTSGLGFVICAIADNFMGSAGRGIATIGISTIGVLALVGRITWTQALIVGVGCAVLFGAPQLITILGSGYDCD